MKIDVTASDDITIIKPYNDIRVNTMIKLRGVFENLLNEGALKVAVDLANVALIDSSGIGLLMNFGKRQKDNNGCLCLYNYSEDIKELLDFVEMGNFIPVYKTFNEVKEALSE